MAEDIVPTLARLRYSSLGGRTDVIAEWVWQEMKLLTGVAARVFDGFERTPFQYLRPAYTYYWEGSDESPLEVQVIFREGLHPCKTPADVVKYALAIKAAAIDDYVGAWLQQWGEQAAKGAAIGAEVSAAVGGGGLGAFVGAVGAAAAGMSEPRMITYPKIVQFTIGDFFSRFGFIRDVKVLWSAPWAVGGEAAGVTSGQPYEATVNFVMKIVTKAELGQEPSGLTVAAMGQEGRDNLP